MFRKSERASTSEASILTALAVSMALTSISLPAALAQSAGDDSLLPPEVVPLDPSVAQTMSQAQAQARMANSGEAQAVPGLASDAAGAGAYAGMQNAQDWRKAALNSLVGQDRQMPPQMLNSSQQWRANSFSGNGQVDGVALSNAPIMQSAPGQYQMGQSPMMMGSASQSQLAYRPQQQTLSGRVKNKPRKYDIRRAGITNALSAAGGFASGVVVGSLVRRPNSLYGLSLFGLGLTGLGSRNGFRF